MTTEDMKALRTAVADYMRSEGCSCCEDTEAHKKAEAEIAKLLKVKKYKDGSGYNFRTHATKRK